jgi:hypothetical protein
MLRAMNTTGESAITRDGSAWTWKFTVRDPSSTPGAGEPSENVGALAFDLDGLRVVLQTGRFETAEGFTLSDDRRVATLKELDESSHDQSEQPMLTLKLVWK